MSERFDDLNRLAEMRDKGDITEAEYQRLKADLLTEGKEKPASAPGEMENQTRWWLIGTGALMAIGSFLPWVQFGIFSTAGTDGDGIFTLIGGVAIALIGVANRVTLFTGIAAVAIGAFSIWIVVTVFNNLYDPLDISAGGVGGGLYLTGLASLFAVIAGLQLIGEARKRQASA